MSQQLAPLNNNVVSKLKDWEDFVSAFIQVEEVSSAYSWLKADILLQLSKTFGEKSLHEFSKEVNQKPSTISNYVRTSRGFPPEKRLENISFSHHFQASMADEFDTKQKAFLTDSRFKWIERAADEDMSTRALAEEIQYEKTVKQLGKAIIPCDFCAGEEDTTKQYILYAPRAKKEAEKFYLHDSCYNEIVDFINRGKQEGTNH